MPQVHSAVKLTRARFLQLQLFASSIGSTVAGAIEALMSAAAERGEIPDALDGISIERQGERIVLTLSGQALPALSVPEARALASRLGGFAARTIEGSSTVHKLADGTEIAIRRVGRGFALASGPARIVVTAGMISDIKRQLRGAAA